MPASSEKKNLYQAKIEPYKAKIESLKKELGKSKAQAKRDKNLGPFFTIQSAGIAIAYVNTFLLMSRLSERIQGMKIPNYLDQARKETSNTLTELCKVFGNQLNASLTENQALLERLSIFDPPYKLRFMQEMKSCIRQVKQDLGEGSKWRWSFPDIHYRFLIFLKNCYDFKLYERTKDPRHEYYRPLQDYLHLLMEEAQYTAQEFRSRHELSTQEIDDLQKIRDILEMQKQLCIITGNHTEQERIETSLENISEKIESLIAKKSKKLEDSV